MNNAWRAGKSSSQKTSTAMKKVFCFWALQPAVATGVDSRPGRGRESRKPKSPMSSAKWNVLRRWANHLKSYQNDKYPSFDLRRGERRERGVVNIGGPFSRWRCRAGGYDPFLEFFGIPQ